MRRIREELYQLDKTSKQFSRFALTVFPYLKDVDPEEYFERFYPKYGRPRRSYTGERKRKIPGRTIEIAPGRRGVIVSRDKQIASRRRLDE
jgi:hypothetical protein